MNLDRFIFTICLALIVFSIPAVSYGFTVTNLNDSGPGSFRQAIIDTPEGGTVDFEPGLSGTITLLSLLTIEKSLNIVGPGADVITITEQGLDDDVLILIDTSVSNDVSISGLRFADITLPDGQTPIGYRNLGLGNPPSSLTIDKCVFENNSAEIAGVIGVSPSDNEETPDSITISNSTFRNNSGFTGVLLSGVGVLDLGIFNSTFESNTSLQDGNNSAAAIGISSAIHRLKIYNSTFDSNVSSCQGEDCLASGAAIAIFAGFDACSTIDIRFNTFNNNNVSCTGNGCISDGSSIFFVTNQEVNNCKPTIMSNIFNSDSPSNNCAVFDQATEEFVNPSDFIISLGYNLSNDGTCAVGGPGDKANIDPLLDPQGPRNNGGMTETIALLAGSPAIDMGGPDCPPPDTDQRMVPRPQGSACDSGSFEFMATAIPTLSEWGLIALAGVLGIVGLLAARNRRAAAKSK